MSNIRLDAQSFFSEAYSSGFVPWEIAAEAGAAEEEAFFDREDAAHPGPQRRALDIGCGRGRHALSLTRRQWQVTGVDFVEGAIETARALPGSAAVDFIVGDVIDLPSLVSGQFDFFFDGGCFHGLSPQERAAWGRGVSVLAAPGATLLMVAFEPWPPGAPPPPNVPAGTTLAEVRQALPGWELLNDDLMPDSYRPVPQPAHFYRLRDRQG